MTVIYEQREINNRVLLIQFLFQSYRITINGSQVEGCSLDKYLSVDVWSQIYIKLESQLEKYQSNIKTKLEDTVIPLRRAQLELNVSWENKTPLFEQIADQEAKHCDLCPYVLMVKVSMVSQLTQFKKQHSQEIKTERPASIKTSTKVSTKSSAKTSTKSSTKSDTNELSEVATSSSASTNRVVEEYVPEAITNFENIPDYTPSALTNNIECKIDSKSDEYDPSNLSNPIDDESETIVYTPKKIDPNRNVKTDLNRNDYPDRRKRTNKQINALLFGDLSDELEPKNHSTSRLLRSTDKTRLNSQGNLNSWLTHRDHQPDNDQKENGREIDLKKKRKLNTDTCANERPAEKSDSKVGNAEKMHQLAAEVRRQKRKPRNEHFIDLMDMDLDEINETFTSHETVLKKTYQKYLKIPDNHIKSSNHLLIMPELIRKELHSGMYIRCRDEFEGTDRPVSITTNHENLYWKILAPEWALQIFMKKFSLNREEAIEQLKKQDAAKNKDDDDDDFLNS